MRAGAIIGVLVAGVVGAVGIMAMISFASAILPRLDGEQEQTAILIVNSVVTLPTVLLFTLSVVLVGLVLSIRNV